MDRWDGIIIFVAGYVAIMSLVRMMAKRRNQVVDYVRGKIAENRGSKSPTQKPNEKDNEAA